MTSEIKRFWEWKTEDGACEFCKSMEGSIHSVDDEMNTHPNCRCIKVPYIFEGLESQDDVIERTLNRLKEERKNLAPFKFEPGTIQYKAWQAQQKIEKRARYVKFVYGDAKKADALIKEFGLHRVYLSADLHPMTRKALLIKYKNLSDEEFEKAVKKAYRQDKVRMRKGFESKQDRPDLKANALDPFYDPDEEDYFDEWFGR